MNCDERKLSLYLDGELAERAGMEAHLAECGPCRAKLESFRRADGLLGEVADRMAPPVVKRAVVRRRWWPKVVSAAAALLLAFGGFWGWFNARTPDPQEVAVVGATEIVPGTKARYRVLVTDARTGAPVSDAKVWAILYDAKSRELAECKVRSDATGSAEVALDVPELAEQMVWVALTVDSAAGHDSLSERATIIRPARLLISTDKPIYQPAQTVHIRTLVMNSVTTKPLAKAPVTLEVEDPNGNKVFKRELTTSDFGLAAADFRLADEVTMGRYRIVARVDRKIESERVVEVKRYVLPKFRVSVGTQRAFYAPGEKLSGTIDAEYFFQKPVATGRAHISLQRWTGEKFDEFEKRDIALDEKGHRTFEATLHDTFYGIHSDEAILRIEATVTDAAEHAETRVIGVPVSREPLRVAVVPRFGEIVPGLENRIYVVCSYPDGRPAKCIVNGRMETDETGVIELSLGRLMDPLTLDVRDRDGHVASVVFNPSRHANRDQDFAILLDQNAYRAGETMTVTALATFESGTIYLDLVKGGQTLLTKALEVRDFHAKLPVDLPAELFGTIHVNAYRIGRDGQTVHDSKLIVVDLKGDLQIRPRIKPSYEPGEKITVDFELLDSDGKPLAGAISLAVVDEAVFALHDARPGLEKEYFKIQDDLMKSRVQLKPCDVLTDRRATPVRCSVVEEPEPSVLGRVSYWVKDARLDEAKRGFNDRATAGVAVCLLGLIAVGAVWGLLRLIRDGRWLILVEIAAIAGLILLAIPKFAGRSKFAQEVATAAPKMSASGDTATMSTDSAPDKDETRRGAPRVREFFPETLYWNPEIITDEKGRASVTFEGADSITTWRMAMSAVTRDGHLGAGESGLKVFQPFFVDLDLPVALTQGDEIWLPVAVYNYLKEPQEVDLTFTAESGFEVLDGAKKKVVIAANDVLSVNWHVRAKEFGVHKLKVEAIGGLFSDAIRRPIEVYPDGKEMPFAKSERLDKQTRFTIDLPADAIDGATRAQLKLFPSTFSDIVTGLDRLVRMPYG